MWIFDFAFVANSEKCRKYTFLDGSTQIIMILHRFFSEFITALHGGGGPSQFITILQRGGYQNLIQYYMGGVFPIYYNITMGGGGGLSGPQICIT